MTKLYVWSLATRIFHILFIVLTLLVYISSEFDKLLEYHVIFAYSMGLLVLGRIAWGFMDIEYSKFKDFNLKIKDLKDYMFSVLFNKKEYIGHNPASSWAIISMFALVLISVVTGSLTFGTQEGMGIFSYLNTTFFKEMELFEELHEFFSQLFFIIVIIHIIGVILDRYLHKTKNIESMIYGYKNSIRQIQNIRLTIIQKLFSIIWITLPILLSIYLLTQENNFLLKDTNKISNYQLEHPLFYNECISCHTLYPPHLLSSSSWSNIMDDLENHFGDDASLDEEDTKKIKDYLVKNSAEFSSKESAFKMLISDTNNLGITKSNYWKQTHSFLDKKYQKENEIKNISNCKVCHNNIEKGLLNDKDIKIMI